MLSVGIDLGEATSHATIFANEKAETFEFPMDSTGYATLKERVPQDARIVFESSGTAYPFFRQLRELGYTDIGGPPQGAGLDREIEEEERQGRQPEAGEAP